MKDYFKKFFFPQKKQEPIAEVQQSRSVDFSFPDFLDQNPLVRKEVFRNVSKYEKGGTSVVFPFHVVSSSESENLGYEYRDYVVKRYDWQTDQTEELLFGRGCKQLSLHEKCVILKARHKRIENFFSEFPDLVVSSEYVLSGKTKDDAKIYEIQKRIYGCVHDLLSEDFDAYLYMLKGEQRENMAKKLEQIIAHIEQKIHEESIVPDINFSNFIFTFEGEIKYIDTNVEFDWKNINRDPKTYEQTRAHQIRSLEKLKYFLSKLIQF